MNILCFGDSNTWGYKPDKTGRFDEKQDGPGFCSRNSVRNIILLKKVFAEELPFFRMSSAKAAVGWI